MQLMRILVSDAISFFGIGGSWLGPARYVKTIRLVVVTCMQTLSVSKSFLCSWLLITGDNLCALVWTLRLLAIKNCKLGNPRKYKNVSETNCSLIEKTDEHINASCIYWVVNCIATIHCPLYFVQEPARNVLHYCSTLCGGRLHESLA